jgi:hypothetical protein
MKFNREYLEELTLQKIKEVNDEAGYRKYLEVPEMVEIVASIIEKQVNPHDGSTLDSFLLEEAELKIKNLEEELEKWKACADMLFVYADKVKCGTHIQALWEAACQDIEKYKELKMKIEITKSTPEQEKFQALFNQTDEETIALLVKENEELYAKLEAWKTCADNLIDYAHEYVAHLSTWGKGYNRYDKDIKQAEDAIEEYLKLKNEK